MNSVMGITISGMRAAQHGVQMAAHNVANVATVDAQRPQLQRSSVEQGGVKTTLNATDSNPTTPLGDLLSPKAEVVAFAANASVICRQDQRLGSLLDREV